MVGYKVVREWPPGGLVSAFPFGQVVAYGVGVRTTRPAGCGPLGVFVDLKAARTFAREQVGFRARVYRCVYRRSRARTFWSVNRRCSAINPCDLADYADWVELVGEEL